MVEIFSIEMRLEACAFYSSLIRHIFFFKKKRASDEYAPNTTAAAGLNWYPGKDAAELWVRRQVYWALGATVPWHTCTGAMPMRQACLHEQTRLPTSISRGNSTRGESEPWKHGILDAEEGMRGAAHADATPHEKKKT